MAIGGLLAAFLIAGVITAPAPPTCLIMIHDREFVRITGAPTPLATLPDEVNALGFHEGREIYYGVTHSHLVSITPTGTVTRLIPTPEPLRWATAGAIHGDQWFVRGGGDLHVISLKDLSFSSVRVESQSWGDFDWHDGLLYGIAVSPAHLVSLDPVSGKVRTVAGLNALPEDGSFGSLEIDAGGVVHAFHNRTGRLYSFALNAPDQVTVNVIGPAEISDFAGCPRPKPSPSPSPSPSKSPSPSPSPSRSPSPSPFRPASPVPTPALFLPQPPPPLPPPPSSAPPPTPPPIPVLRAAEPVPEPERPEKRPATRTFFVGMLVPAVVVAARGIGRRR